MICVLYSLDYTTLQIDSDKPARSPIILYNIMISVHGGPVRMIIIFCIPIVSRCTHTHVQYNKGASMHNNIILL